MIGQILIVDNDTYLAKQGGGTIAGMHEVNLLAAGAVAVFTEDGTMVPATPAGAFEDQAAFVIAVGQDDGNAYVSKTIQRGTLGNQVLRYRGVLYNSALDVAEKLWVGDNADNAYDVNLPSTLVAGTEYSIRIDVDDTGFIDTNSSSTYSYVVKTGDAKGDVLTALVTTINADTVATATGVDVTTANAGIQLVCNTTGVRMQVSCFTSDDGGWAPDMVTAFNNNKGATTPPLAPSLSPGNATLVEKEVQAWLAMRGRTNRRVFTEDFFVDKMPNGSTTNYDTYMVQYGTPTPNGVDPQYLKIFMEDGLTTGAGKTKDALDDIFVEAFNLATDPSETGALDEAEA